MAILSSEIVAIVLPLHMHLLCIRLSTRQQLLKCLPRLVVCHETVLRMHMLHRGGTWIAGHGHQILDLDAQIATAAIWITAVSVAMSSLSSTESEAILVAISLALCDFKFVAISNRCDVGIKAPDENFNLA